MRRRWRWLILLCVPVVLLVGILWHGQRDVTATIVAYEPVDRAPRIRPDYVGTVIPPNMAPLNFLVEESGREYSVRIYSTQGKAIQILSRTPRIVIPVRPWNRLLGLNRGNKLHFDVFAKGSDGQWRRFDTITNTVAREDIDGYLVYRLMKPLYLNWAGSMGIYQRNLQEYEETVLLHSSSISVGCLNCHTFLNNRTATMAFHIRGGPGAGMILARNGSVSKVDTRTKKSPSYAAHFSWHPSGRIGAFSINRISLFLHAVGEGRDLWDAGSDLALYMVDSNAVTSSAKIAAPDRWETWPTWSPDGRYLYFCSVAPMPPARYRDVRYDLMRVSYDLETGAWGDLETVIAAQETGLSITQPRISPNGRFLLFCMQEYGTFPVWLNNSDLYMMDLKTGEYRRLDINSDQTESWHCWSSNSRWIVFSSKRLDGLFARPFFSYIDGNGKAHKPLLLPQKDPAFYDSLVRTYNVPELVMEPVPIPATEFRRAAYASSRGVDAITGPTPPTEAPQQPSSAKEPDSWDK